MQAFIPFNYKKKKIFFGFEYPYYLKSVYEKVREGQEDKWDTGVANGLLELVWTAAVGLFLDAELRRQDEARP